MARALVEASGQPGTDVRRLAKAPLGLALREKTSASM